MTDDVDFNLWNSSRSKSSDSDNLQLIQSSRKSDRKYNPIKVEWLLDYILKYSIVYFFMISFANKQSFEMENWLRFGSLVT